MKTQSKPSMFHFDFCVKSYSQRGHVQLVNSEENHSDYFLIKSWLCIFHFSLVELRRYILFFFFYQYYDCSTIVSYLVGYHLKYYGFIDCCSEKLNWLIFFSYDVLRLPELRFLIMLPIIFSFRSSYFSGCLTMCLKYSSSRCLTVLITSSSLFIRIRMILSTKLTFNNR